MKDIETRFAVADDLELRVGEGETPNRLVGYAAVFNSLSADLGGFKERLLPGAFKDSVTGGGDIRALVGHDPNQLLGRTSNGTLRVSEDERGLRVEVDLPDTSYGRDLREMVRRRDIRGMSFGFRVRKGGDSFTKEGGQTIRELRSVDLREVSAVASPAYDSTNVQLRVDPAAVAHVRDMNDTPELVARRMRLRRAMLV